MRQTKTTEILVGMFIVAGLVAAFVLTMQVSNMSSMSQDGSYAVTARFENIGGLKVRSAVKAGGVLVGRVSAINYDIERFEAVVTLDMNQAYNEFPDDTTASIFTAGLLGEQYVALEPGGADEMLANGSEIEMTQSALVIEQLVSKFLFNKAAE